MPNEKNRINWPPEKTVKREIPAVINKDYLEIPLENNRDKEVGEISK